MKPLNKRTEEKRTKIVATIGPASDSQEVMTQMMLAGMNVARLNFSHGKYDEHARRIARLREVAQNLDLPLMLLQDLQGPKIRVGELPPEGIQLVEGESLTLVPMAQYTGQPNTVAIDYPYVAEEAEAGTQVLLDDGLLELRVEKIDGAAVVCWVVEGGLLKSRKGVNLPSLNLRLPSMTEKDILDLDFGIAQGVDLISLSFVRKPEDIQALKALLTEKGADIPVLAKLEKPQAIANLESIVNECDAIMVARGDLGVEMSPEKVPLIQKEIIHLCNQKGIPVITATQMLDSMIYNPRPTRAEASDVANAIMDGTDAVMLSGESAVGAYPVESVKMLARIAKEVESSVDFTNYPPYHSDDTAAISQALHSLDDTLDLKCIVTFTETGYTAQLASAERPKAPLIAYTPHPTIYRRLCLNWGVRPILMKFLKNSLEELLPSIDEDLIGRDFASAGDKVLIMGGLPMGEAGRTNFLKLHTVKAGG
ncbi:MAG: Pyruvate kinase [Chroococcopsis gigantea SAG 12.99]|jgi:pyruvate kinase|nr:pyruvate kinase [Chlorogloea purpurea SAG 13.99]MDV3000747.1 Pyruvate kinase [Chroococcopsis gigantea SAG 12.99]